VRPLIVLALAVLGISFAAPLVRLSTAHPLAIAVWRLGFSLIVIVGILLAQGSWRQWRKLGRRDLVMALGAGGMLALHFWSWNASIGMTTIAASVVLVNLHPVFVAVGSGLFLHEPPSRTQWIGILIAITGALLVGASDLRATGGFRLTNGGLSGDVLALVGAITVALYYLAGRRLRQTLDLWPYVGLVYGTAFVTLLALAAVAHVHLAPQPPRDLLIFAGLALGPMLLGHTGMNWALRYLPSYVVSLTTLGEPIGATLIAALLPGIAERPTLATLAGGALVLTGALVASQRSKRP
jgi:drug/metabolite transporter (DMT)-like permease